MLPCKGNRQVGGGVAMRVAGSRGIGGVGEAHLDGELAGWPDVKVWVHRRHGKSYVFVQEGTLEG